MRAKQFRAWALVLVAALASAPSGKALATTILLYTQNSWENWGGPGTGLPDDEFQYWLTNQLGDTVVRKTITSGLSSAAMQKDITDNGASLVIFGPRNTSGNYTDKTINTTIATPILSLLPHAIRSDRLDWTSAGTGGDNVGWTTYDWLQPNDPRVKGIGTTIMTYPGGGGNTRWSLATYDASFNVVGGGQGKAIGGRTVDPTTKYAEFMEWRAGDKLDGNQTTLGRRVYFGITDWATALPGNNPATFDVTTTADGKHVLARIINDLIADQITTPVAVPGGPYLVTPGGSVQFDASGSYTTGAGKITSYAWDLNNDGLTDFTGVQPMISYSYLTDTLNLGPGTYGFSLTVNTNDYETATANGTFSLYIPEPATLSLVALGGLALLRRRKR